MSALRILRELTMLVAVVGGAALGYMAGQNFDSATHIVCSFAGMAICGAFADFCMRGEK
jgi:hypothetical protein